MYSTFKSQSVNEVLDYEVALSQFLGTGEVVSAAIWSVSPSGPNITDPAPSQTSNTATVWFSGGIVGVTYDVQGLIETSGARTLEVDVFIAVTN